MSAEFISSFETCPGITQRVYNDDDSYMILALSKGISQLREPSTANLVLMCLGIVILLFVILFVFIDIGLRYTSIFQVGWLENISDMLGRLTALILSWLLFPAAISAVIGLFVDRIARAVEDRHYPSLAPVVSPQFFDALIVAMKFFVVLISLNIFLLFFIFTGPIYIFLYYLVNGYIISREFFELIALRRLDTGTSIAIRKKFQFSLIIVGVFFTFLMTIPVVNLLVPIVATTTMVHLFEIWRAKYHTDLKKT